MLEAYLGNNIYAEFVEGQICLYMEDGRRKKTNIVRLDAETLTALNRYADRVKEVLFEKFVTKGVDL